MWKKFFCLFFVCNDYYVMIFCLYVLKASTIPHFRDLFQHWLRSRVANLPCMALLWVTSYSPLLRSHTQRACRSGVPNTSMACVSCIPRRYLRELEFFEAFPFICFEMGRGFLVKWNVVSSDLQIFNSWSLFPLEFFVCSVHGNISTHSCQFCWRSRADVHRGTFPQWTLLGL